MKFLSFDYVDAKGKQSVREVIQLSPPQPNHFCIDVVELEPVDQAMLMIELEDAQKEAIKAREYIMSKYDVSKNYRYFNPAGMTNIVEED